MTNEQTYLLLAFLADVLEREVIELRERLPEGMERHLEWWRVKDDRRMTALERFTLFASDWKKAGFEQRPTGDFIALEGLVDFLEELKLRAESLLVEDSQGCG